MTDQLAKEVAETTQSSDLGPQSSIDPIRLEVLWNRLISVVNEQAAALMRISFTPTTREAGDISAAVFDSRGYMMAQAVTGTPGHINPLATAIRHCMAEYPNESLRPGDVLVTNDPWKTAGHLNDLTVLTPIFNGDRVVAYFGNICHTIDIGGRIMSAQAREVYEEGLNIPITKLYDQGRPNLELFKIIRANVRSCDLFMGDLHAQVACNDVGGESLLRLMREFGLEDVDGLADEIIGRSEAATRRAIASIPDGDYEYEAYADGFDDPVVIKVTVRIRGDEMTADYAGTSPQSRYGINVVLSYTHAYATYAMKCAVSPEVPNNEGTFRPIKTTAPEGCVLNALFPAPVAARHILGHFIPGAIFGALQKVIPGKVIAEGAANLWNSQTSGRRRNGTPWTYMFLTVGGTGARPTKDGLSATSFPSGVMGVPIEVLETVSPLMLRRKELRPDSGGPGRYRGGLGQDMQLGARTNEPWLYSMLYDRFKFPAQGFGGGRPGAPGYVELTNGEKPHSKQQFLMEPDWESKMYTPGGGGYGDPFERDPALVLDDVLDGLVSVESARRDYGVAVDVGGKRVDEEETAKLRGRGSERVPLTKRGTQSTGARIED